MGKSAFRLPLSTAWVPFQMISIVQFSAAGDTTIPTGVFLDGLNIDTLVLMKFVPDLDIELSVMKINGNPDDVDAFKKESYYFLFNVGNKDTTLYFEY